MSRRISVARCLALALGVTLAAPAFAGGNGIDLGGSVAGSYFYNTNNPDDGENTNAPLHWSHNEFQLDQAVISLSRERNDEQKVGFQIRGCALPRRKPACDRQRVRPVMARRAGLQGRGADSRDPKRC